MVSIKIQGINEIVKNFMKAPAVVEPLLQKGIDASQAILAKHTVKGVVPWKTGALVQTFKYKRSRLKGEWFPTRKYAIFVEMGTRPHIIRARNKKVLADKKAGIIFGKVVHHSGTRPNKFMERIAELSQPEITMLFKQVRRLIIKAVK